MDILFLSNIVSFEFKWNIIHYLKSIIDVGRGIINKYLILTTRKLLILKSLL